MNNDAERIELNELCSGLVDGTLSAAQHARLEELLLSSAEARRFYVRSMHLSASLTQYAGEMQTPEADNIIRPPQWRRWVGPLAAAAIVLFGVWVGKALIGGKPGLLPMDDEDSVAKLSASKDCVWVAGAPQPGDELGRGQRLDLKSGYAEVTFDSGAQLVMQGPATLDLRSEWEAELKRGTVKANVPQEAIGFRVTHATVDVVDLGTEFSMTAADDGAAEVFVLKGAVEVKPKVQNLAGAPSKSVLREKQSRRFAKAGASEVRDSDEKFQVLMRKVLMERMRNPMAWARWRFDAAEGGAVQGENSSFITGPMRVGKDADRLTEGRWGRALAFDGDPAAKLQGSLKRGVRTVAFWVKLPQVSSAGNSSAIVGLPLGKGTLGAVEFSVNSHPGDGTPGALRLDGAGGWIIGSTPLLDGRWHHVAAVFRGAPKNPAKSVVNLYIDGRLESPSGRQGLQHRADSSPGDAMWLGGDGFRGLIDELVIADRPLTPHEIRHLMRSNELVSPDNYAGN